MSLGMKAEEAHGSLRLTLGKHTTKKEIDETVKILKRIVGDLRKISGNILSDYYKKNH
jgi:cysteine desulfurase